MHGADGWIAVLFTLAIIGGIYRGVRDGIQSVRHPRPPPVKEKPPKPDPFEPPPGKVWVRLGKKEWLIDESLTEPRPEPKKPRRQRRKTRQRTKVSTV